MEEIAWQTGGDLMEIEPLVPYDKNRDHYDELAAYAKKEHDEDQRPAIKNAIDLSGYDTVFIGYSMWWYTFPMIIYTLFDTVDFSGKTVVPFNTHMGSGDGGTYKTVREKANGGRVFRGLPTDGLLSQTASHRSYPCAFYTSKFLENKTMKIKIDFCSGNHHTYHSGRTFRTRLNKIKNTCSLLQLERNHGKSRP